jgi:hypothetical protein
MAIFPKSFIANSPRVLKILIVPMMFVSDTSKTYLLSRMLLQLFLL